MRRWRSPLLAFVVVLVLVALALTSLTHLGGDDFVGARPTRTDPATTALPPATTVAPPATAPRPSPPVTAVPPTGTAPRPSQPLPGLPTWVDSGALEEQERECERLNTGASAAVVWEGTSRMRLDETSDIRAAVTVRRDLPPALVLPDRDVRSERVAVITCQVEARLAGAEDEFTIDDGDYVTRSLLASDTVRWTWRVTPRAGGDHTLTLFLRPIVVVGIGDVSRVIAANANTAVREYETRVHVDVPWNKRPEELMRQVASTLNVAEGLVKAATALLVALIAAGVVLRRRGRGGGDAPDPAG